MYMLALFWRLLIETYRIFVTDFKMKKHFSMSDLHDNQVILVAGPFSESSGPQRVIWVGKELAALVSRLAERIGFICGDPIQLQSIFK